MTAGDLPLFAWTPPRQIIVFPMVSRIGRIRSTAEKLLDKPTERAASSYRKQVTDALIRQFDRLGVPEREQDEQIGAFWSMVENEMTRLCYAGNGNPQGAA